MDKLITTIFLARQLKIKHSHFLWYCRNYRIPLLMLGKRTYIKEENVQLINIAILRQPVAIVQIRINTEDAAICSQLLAQDICRALDHPKPHRYYALADNNIRVSVRLPFRWKEKYWQTCEGSKVIRRLILAVRDEVISDNRGEDGGQA